MKYVMLSWVAVIMVSCVSNTPYTIDEIEAGIREVVFTPTYGEYGPLLLSDIAEKVEYIPLFTDKAYSAWGEIAVSDEFYFVRSAGTVLQFKKDGSLVRPLNKEGRGPGEVFARSFTIDNEGKRVFVYSNYEHIIQIYGFDGSHQRTIKTPVDNITHFTKDVIYFNNALIPITYHDENSRWLMSAFDIETESRKILVEDTRFDSVSRTVNGWVPINELLYQKNDTMLFYNDMGNDTIFAINKDWEKTPRFLIDLGADKSSFDEISRNNREGPITGYQNYKHFIYAFAETDSFIFVDLRTEHTFPYRELGVYDKRDQTIKVTIPYKDENGETIYVIENDLDGLMPCNVFSITEKLGCFNYENGAIYALVEAIEFERVWKSTPMEVKESSEYLKMMAPVYDEIDAFNDPLIMKIYLK